MEEYAEDLPDLPEQSMEESPVSSEKDASVDPLKLLVMSEDEIDKVLEEEGSLGEMFSHRSDKAEQPEGPEEKDALSDIQEMLQMSDDHVLLEGSGKRKGVPFGEADDREDMQSLLGSFSGAPESPNGLGNPLPEEGGKQKKERNRKKDREEKKKEKEEKRRQKGKKKEENGEEKKTFGKKIAALFFDSDDDLEEAVEKEKGKEKAAEGGKEGEVKEKKKKKKEKKPPKKEKAKDPAKEAKKKQQKEKKAEKAKAKAEKAEIARKEKRAEKKLPKKRVAVWVVLCASIGAGILLINSVGMAAIQLTEARNAFEDKEYETVYQLMNGRELSEEDQLIFRQSSAMLHMQHAGEAYQNHLKLKKPVKALEDLLKGVRKYQELLETGQSELITPELTAEYQGILGILQDQYALSEAGASEINAIESDYEYSLQLEALVNGETYQSQAEMQLQEEEAAQAFPELEDLLPEEEEYLNGSGG